VTGLALNPFTGVLYGDTAPRGTNTRQLILGNGCRGATGVLAEGETMPIGITYPMGLVKHRQCPAATFRLVTDKTVLPGRWLCMSRRFVQLGEAAGKTDDDEMRARPV
jgi:hypothetical protein